MPQIIHLKQYCMLFCYSFNFSNNTNFEIRGKMRKKKLGIYGIFSYISWVISINYFVFRSVVVNWKKIIELFQKIQKKRKRICVRK